MTPCRAALFANLLAVLVVGASPAAAALAPGCAGIALEPDPSFRSRFPDLLERIEQELKGRTDIDPCARVELKGSESLIVVAVMLPDGRAAARTLTRREDVLPSLQALLLVPEPAPLTEPVASAPPSRESNNVRLAQPQRYARDEQSVAPISARQFGYELSVISGVRMGAGQFGYGAGLLSFLEVKRWLFGFQGRADGYRSLSGGDAETVLELALLGGRRFDLGSLALDVTIGPGVAMRGVTFSQTESVAVMMARSGPPPSPPPREEHSTGPMPRLLLGTRLGFSPRSVFRTFVGLDGELGPTDTRSPDEPSNAARLPTFSIGLALGATVGTP